MTKGDRAKSKTLIAISASFDPLPAAGEVILRYKLDGVSSYTLVATNNTNDATVIDWIGVDSSGNQLGVGRDIEFQLESSGKAVINEFRYQYEVAESRG